MVSVIRRFVEEMAERMGADEDLSGRVALAAHELLENVAKYADCAAGNAAGAGDHGQGTLRLDIQDEGTGRRLVVRVDNVTAPRHVVRLRQIFRDMSAASDPHEYYFGLMNAVHGQHGGIGLARIQAEAEMKLHVAIDGQAVSISATTDTFTVPSEALR